MLVCLEREQCLRVTPLYPRLRGDEAHAVMKQVD